MNTPDRPDGFVDEWVTRRASRLEALNDMAAWGRPFSTDEGVRFDNLSAEVRLLNEALTWCHGRSIDAVIGSGLANALIALPVDIDRRCLYVLMNDRPCCGYRGTHPLFCASHRRRERKPPAARLDLSRPPMPRPHIIVPPPTVWPARRCGLTDAECWAQGPGWETLSYGLGRKRRDERPPTQCAACSSEDLAWNGESWWCNPCGARVYPVIVEWYDHEIRLPATTYEVAPTGDDAEYRAATRLFHAGAVTNRPFGWVSPHWNRRLEGKRQARR